MAACVGGACKDRATESNLAECLPGDVCVVVPYSHCCGATKRAINLQSVDAYYSHPAWQIYDGPCEMIGICRDDRAVTEAVCELGQCQMVFP